MLPLRPTPNSKRPWLIWSTVAASSAMRKGWIRGNTWTAMPTRNRLVRVAIEQATMIGAARTERLGLKCISPSHTVSSPEVSARSTRSKASLNASACVPPWRRTKSRNMPKSIRYLLLEARCFDPQLSYQYRSFTGVQESPLRCGQSQTTGCSSLTLSFSGHGQCLDKHQLRTRSASAHCVSAIYEQWYNSWPCEGVPG